MNGCLNGGSCVSDEKKQTFSCICKQPWTGDNCEKTGEIIFYFLPLINTLQNLDSDSSKMNLNSRVYFHSI